MDERLLPRESEREGRRWTEEVAEEGRRLGYLAAPMVAVLLTQFLVPVVSTMVVGHLGELALSSSSIATSLSSVTGFSVVLGVASGLDTLCGQAYGAQQYEKLGLQTYRAIFCILLICIPISILWLNLEKLMLLFQQDPAISHEAQRYIVWLIPGLFASAFCQSIVKFLQAQSLILPMLFAGVLTLCLHVPLCMILVYHSGMNNLGAALATSISYWLNVFMLGLYVMYSSSCKATRVLPSREVFRGISQFLWIALPSATMVCLEWWSYELLVLLSGLLPNPQLEASVISICLSSVTTLYTIPYGLGSALSTRISNELGAGNHEGARRAVWVGVLVAFSEALIMSVTILLLRSRLGYAFSNEVEVVTYVTKMAPLLSIEVILDNLQAVFSGVARGCGWQHLGACINLGAYYLFGIPIAVMLGFLFQYRGQGLWIGILCGVTIQSTLLALVTIFTDWRKQAEKARERVFGQLDVAEEILK